MNTIRPTESTFIAASGKKYTIRETNGDDDAILSNSGGAQDGSSLNKWIAGIVTAVGEEKKKLTQQEAAKLLSRDRFGILFHSRIFSLGPVLKFIHQCSDPKCSFKPGDDLPYEEDLSLYVWDFTNPAPKPGEVGYSKYRLEVYPNKPEEWVEKKLSSGRLIRFAYLDGEGENTFLEVAPEDLNKNHELLSHKLEAKLETDKWIRLENFKLFSSREMAEIRSHITIYDKPWDAISEIKCPKCRKIDYLNLLAVPDFFFPTVI